MREASLVSSHAAREDSCVSTERLHKEKVCFPLIEGRHYDLAEAKKYVVVHHRRTGTFGLGGCGGAVTLLPEKNYKMPESVSCTYVLKFQ